MHHLPHPNAIGAYEASTYVSTGRTPVQEFYEHMSLIYRSNSI